MAITIGLDVINQEDISMEAFNNLIKEESLLYIKKDLLNHREKIKDPKNLLKLNSITREEFLTKVAEIKKNLDVAFEKCKLNFNLSVYSLEKPENKIMKFELDPKKLLKKDVLTMYKLNLKTGTNVLPLSNSLFFFNRNQTLPLGMDYSTEILVNLKPCNLLKIRRRIHHILKLSDNSSKQEISEINVTEFNI